MTKKLIGHYITKIFIDDDLAEAEMKDARCNFCGMHDDIDGLFDERAEYEVTIETTNEIPWDGCDCVT